jgi:NADPH2:quinone reductase
MKILLSREAGGPETLELAEVAEPVPQPGEVRVKVMACGVNYPDLLMIKDQYQIKLPRPFAPGGEVAGIIEQLGDGVRGFKTGDRVIAAPGWGGMAETITLPAAACTSLPDEIPFADGATFLVTFGTAYHAFTQRARLRRGDHLLVLGAAGGVGSAAVALGHALGAVVVAAASSQAKIDVALAIGAGAGVVYPSSVDSLDDRKALAEQFKLAAGPDGFDVICDSVGGPYAEAALRALAKGGRYLVVGFTAGIPRIPLNLPLLKGGDILGVLYGPWAQREPAANRANIEELLALYRRAAIRPVISARYALAGAPKAIAALAERRTVGKSVIMME